MVFGYRLIPVAVVVVIDQAVAQDGFDDFWITTQKVAERSYIFVNGFRNLGIRVGIGAICRLKKGGMGIRDPSFLLYLCHSPVDIPMAVAVVFC